MTRPPSDDLFADPPPSEPPVYTVSQVTGAVRAALEERIGVVRVQGEISNLRKAASGHYYFTLKDNRAQLRSVLFRGNAASLRFEPADGLEVDAVGEVSVYEPRGDLQLIVRRLQPAGLGALMQAFEALKNRLREEGLFDADRKQELPAFPGTVALVTSSSGAAVRDLIHVLRRRWPPVRIVLDPVRVQGKGAAEEIAEALDRVDRWGGADVIVVGRGGGSLEDLWAFNEEVVARAVAACSTPVVSAVGHETDTTMCDLVADLRAATPSAAAEIVVPDIAEWFGELARLRGRVVDFGERTIRERRERVDSLVRAYGFRRPGEFLLREKQRLDHLGFRLQSAAETRVSQAGSTFRETRARLAAHHPAHRLEGERESLTRVATRLQRSVEERLRRETERVRGAERTLRALDPTAVLERGYSLVRRGADGAVVTSGEALAPGESAVVQFAGDRASVRVTSVEAGRLWELDTPKEE